MPNAQESIERTSGGGSPLPGALREKFESSLSRDLSTVRVHTNQSSASAAHAVGAKAFTLGRNIHFGSGQYDPSSKIGETLLAHEVAHTAQQAGTAPFRQNKLEVSTSGEASEREADQAADAMVSGAAARISSVTSPSSIHREEMVFEDDELQANESLDDRMAKNADAEQKYVESQGGAYVDTGSAGSIKLASMSTVEDVRQARTAIQRVSAANGNLYHRRAAEQSEVDDNSNANEWREREAAEKRVKRTDEIIGDNDKVTATLQGIVDLSEGNSQTDEKGNRPGHDLRLSTFNGLAEGARRDFARLQGVVGAFLDTHKIEKGFDGSAGGKELGARLASGNSGTDSKALDSAQSKIEGAQVADPIFNNLVQDYKAKHSQFESAGYGGKINSQLTNCASAISEAKNISADIDLGQLRPNTPEQAQASASVQKVNADLNAAKGALSKAAAVGKLAVSVMTGPLGMTAASMTAGLSESELIKTTQKIASTSSKIGQGVATVSGQDIQKQVSTDITTAVAKMMTDYENRIVAAQGAVSAANAAAKKDIVKLNTDKLAVAKGNITAAFAALSDICFEVERTKAEMRAAAEKIDQHQKKMAKKGRQLPDVAGITRALSECTAFVEQVNAAITQGEEEQKIGKEMVAKREAVGGKMKATSGKDASRDATGESQLATSEKQDAYIDCESSPPFLMSQHPLRFAIRSARQDGLDERGGQENREALANNSVDVVIEGVATALTALKEDREVAKGFQGALKTAMNM